MSYKSEKAKAQSDTKKYGHYEGKGDGSMKDYKPTKSKKKKIKKKVSAARDKFKKAAMKQMQEEQQDKKIKGALDMHRNRKLK